MPESRHRRRRGRSSPRVGSGSAASSISAPRKKKTNYLYLGASAIIAVLVIVGFALGSVSLGTPGGNQGNADGYVEGVGEQQDTMSTRNHVNDGDTVNYNTVPATSGDHYPLWADCGFYPEGLPDERIVHNQEHSNIIVSYNLTDPAEVEQLREVVDDIGLSNAWGVTRFYDGIEPGQVAVHTWGVLDIMDGIDAERIRTFFETYAGRLGPEGGIAC